MNMLRLTEQADHMWGLWELFCEGDSPMATVLTSLNPQAVGLSIIASNRQGVFALLHGFYANDDVCRLATVDKLLVAVLYTNRSVFGQDLHTIKIRERRPEPTDDELAFERIELRVPDDTDFTELAISLKGSGAKVVNFTDGERTRLSIFYGGIEFGLINYDMWTAWNSGSPPIFF